MGKNLKGKEIGKGIRQRKDGRYEARITIKGSGKPPFSIYGTNLQQVRKQRSMYLAEVLPGVPGGFEPPLTEPKTVVLPLHHRTIKSAAKVVVWGHAAEVALV